MKRILLFFIAAFFSFVGVVAASADDYFVCLGTFKEGVDYGEFLEKLNSAGIETSVVRAKLPSGFVNLVFYSRKFDSKEDANYSAQKLKFGSVEIIDDDGKFSEKYFALKTNPLEVGKENNSLEDGSFENKEIRPVEIRPVIVKKISRKNDESENEISKNEKSDDTVFFEPILWEEDLVEKIEAQNNEQIEILENIIVVDKREEGNYKFTDLSEEKLNGKYVVEEGAVGSAILLNPYKKNSGKQERAIKRANEKREKALKKEELKKEKALKKQQLKEEKLKRKLEKSKKNKKGEDSEKVEEEITEKPEFEKSIDVLLGLRAGVLYNMTTKFAQDYNALINTEKATFGGEAAFELRIDFNVARYFGFVLALDAGCELFNGTQSDKTYTVSAIQQSFYGSSYTTKILSTKITGHAIEFVPVLGFKIGSPVFAVMPFVGPSAAFSLGIKEEIEPVSYYTSGGITETIQNPKETNDLNSAFTLGLNAGLEMMFKAGNGLFVFDFRYGFDFTKVNEYYRRGAVSAGIGYLWKVK